MDSRDDILFGKIALNKRLIRRDLLNRALQYQRTQAPDRPLGEILLEKGILTREQVEEILAFQARVKQIKQTSSQIIAPGAQSASSWGLDASGRGAFPGLEASGRGAFPGLDASGRGAFPGLDASGRGAFPGLDASGRGQVPGLEASARVSASQWAGGPAGSTGGPRPFVAPMPGGGVPTPGMPGGWGPSVLPNGPGSPGGVNGIMGFGQPTPDPEHDPLIGEHVWGCTINQKIGAGGMGAIYLAHHEALRKDVVVKILPPESAANPRTVERFFREARAAAKLDHPNIVQVQHVGTTERGLHYIIMQFVDGKNLEEKIQAEGRQRPPDALKIVMQVAQGLRAAHAAGVIHRDIKAENILVTHAGVVKLTDFGLAKDLNSELKLTADGAMIGTPLYMAPEIGRVKEIDGRVDVYSLGVTFYYLLTGIQPFRGFSALEILSAKAHDKLKPPEEIVPDLPDEYRCVLGKMLEKDREARYGSVEHLIRDLEALDRNLPIEAGQPTIWPPRGPVAAPGGRGTTVKLDKDQGQQLLEQVGQQLKARPRPEKPPGGGNVLGIVALVAGLVLLCAALGGLLWYVLSRSPG